MAAHVRNLFLNLPVRDLSKSMEFWSKLGFEFNKQFTDEKAACMVVGPTSFVMLLKPEFFKTFTKNELCDTAKHTEGLFAVSCGSRAEVEEMVKKAVENGGRHALPAQDHGFMFGWSFYDLDGHHWEPLWMDPKAVQG